MQTRKLRFNILILFTIINFLPLAAQRVASVSGKYVYTLGANDNITIREAKNKAIELAKVDAIKKEFGTLVASDFINIDSNAKDSFSNYYIMESSIFVKGEWLGDEKEPKVEMTVDTDDDLCFIAEVYGKAREIVRAKTDLKWNVKKDDGDKKCDTETFDSGSRFYVDFKSPIDGYISIYLITGDDETACLLPYRKDTTGKVKVNGGQQYTFFDKSVDTSATYYKLSTTEPVESNQLVVLFSPHPFTKCTDTSKDPKHPNVLNSKDFAKWLLKAQRADNDLVVNKKWIQIIGQEQK